MDVVEQEKRFNFAKHKAELIQGADYQEIRSLQLNKCLELSKSDIEPLILKGMLKLIASTDSWVGEFEKVKSERK